MRELVFPRMFLTTAERLADRQAVITETGESRTYAEHLDRVLRLADGMRAELGISPGDRYAVMAANSAPHLELYQAGLVGAGVINSLNLRFAARELTHVIRDSGATVVFTDAIFAPVIDAVRAEAGVQRVVLMGSGDVPHDVAYEDVVAAGKPVVPAEPEESDPCVLMYTGGTTGLPKGVLLEQRAMTLTGYHGAMTWKFVEDDVYLLQTPMFHAASFGGLAIVPAFGGTVTWVSFFEPGAVLRALAERNVTATMMVPTMIGMLLAHPEFRAEALASVRSLTYGASPMPGALLERLLRDYPHMEIYQGYGMTESAAVLTCLQPEDHVPGSPRLRSAGRAVPGVVLSIQDAQGTLLPPGTTGEVCARGGNFMREYWGRPEETAAAFRDGWYHTGDAGYLDEQGYLFLVDRVKDMIVTGGENVYSVEVENALASHPAVAQVAVIGIPHEMWGEAVHAIVVLHPGATATEQELQDHTRQLIAGYKVPKSVEFRSEPLPLSGALKVLKRELRAPYWEGRERAIQ